VVEAEEVSLSIRPQRRLAYLLHMRPLRVHFAALRGLGMIKKIESYPELADPQ
jgi:hypothetical protein